MIRNAEQLNTCTTIEYSQQDPLANLTSRKVTIADLQVFNHKLTTQLKSESPASTPAAEAGAIATLHTC